jgi:hypothetical protein
LIITFQTAATKYLEDNHPQRKKTTIDPQTGKTKTRTMKQLNQAERVAFTSVSKVLYHDVVSSNLDGNDQINITGILDYTDTIAAKKFFDEVYVKMQEHLSNLAVGMAATNAKSNDVNFISDEEDEE